MSHTDEFEHTGRVIRDEMRIAAPPEAVYRAWSDPDAVAAWFVGRAEGRMAPGETITWHWDSTGTGMSQRVLAADPPHRFVTCMELPQGASILEVTIEQGDDGHTILRLVQSGFGAGRDWDEQYEGMLSGWLIALGVLKFFAERYLGRQRREVLVLHDAPYEPEQIVGLQRTEAGLARWLSRSGAPGEAVGEPVRLVLENGTSLTGTVLRNTRQETLWSWDEIGGIVEMKAFRGAHWGSKVGVRISSWIATAAELADIEMWLGSAVGRLTAHLAERASRRDEDAGARA